MTHDGLRAALEQLAPTVGSHAMAWPRLSAHRWTEPQPTELTGVDALSLCAVVSGRKTIEIERRTWTYDPFNYLVLTRGTEYVTQIVEASPEHPYLSLALSLEAGLVRQVASEMKERTLTVLRHPVAAGADPDRPAFVSAFDDELAGALLRFLKAIGTESDRRVLAPLYLREIAYRLLQADQRDRLLQVVAAEATDPVSTAARFVRANLANQLTVAQIAAQVGMSASAFAHLFKEVTGVSPYQFLTQARLDRARRLLEAGDLTVGEVARTVGYTGQSHFSREFRRRFGSTPSSFARATPAASTGR
ncbi:MAG TPA: AraC family transcriptional regulator [Sporichthyaceae bacterium]|nr:AraC family transcriptional regulator [Sporichthyaceae bacterium]